MPLTTVNPALLDTQAQYTGFKNRIINGAMVIDQRNAGASVAAASSQYFIDRWRAELSGGGAYTVQQVTTAPTGFQNSALITVTTADASIASGDFYDVQQFIEGFNVADLGWGTASAQAVALSFWVRSSVTGTFAGSLSNGAANRSYVFTYAISAANTWEYKTVTIPGDTSGTWVTNNGRGLLLTYDLGNGSSYQAAAGSWVGQYAVATSGSVKLISTLSATWQFTGVQLEKGTTATSFDYRPYGTELALCQRYFETSYAQGTAVGTSLSDTLSVKSLVLVSDSRSWSSGVGFQVKKRTTPTMVFYNRLGTSGQWYFGVSGVSEASFAVSTNGVYESGFALVASTTGQNICYGHFTASSEL
jgi:hypothetical protein